MKLSVEMKVAAAVAAGFLAVTVGVVAQGNTAAQAGSPNGSNLTIAPGLHSYPNLQKYNGHKESGSNTEKE